ncbi:MAG: AMP-binding protein [Ktedonobacteraceae bacterium]|nr:AMP-binding protein [Chloroflexota bacterium]
MQETSTSTQTDILYRSREEIRAIQDQRFRHQIKLCFQAHPYYQEVFSRLHLTPQDFQTLDDVHKLPVTTKLDYMKNPMAFRLTALPEFSPQERILWDVSYTTGTTAGVPTPFFNTTHDYFAILEQLKRLCEIIGISEQDTVINLFPLTPVPHIGFLRTRDYATVIGAPVVNTLTGTPYPAYPVHRRLDDAVQMIERHKGTVLSGIVSYVRRVIMRAEELGADLSHVRIVAALGEPCPRGMREDMRRRLVRLGADQKNLVIGNALGFTEMQGSTGECIEFSGGHNPAPDQFHFEVINEQTHEPLPDGERGLFTITHLDRRGTVLLRYVVGDLNAISNEVCPHCGRQGPRIVTNTIRTAELVNLKGTLINPDAIKEAIATVDGIEEYQIVFTKEQPNDPYSADQLLLRVAARPDDQQAIKTQLVARVTEAAEMRPIIEFVANMSDIFDPTKTLKSTRVVDLRPAE